MSKATGISDFMQPPQRLRLTLLGRFAVEGEGVREISAKKNRGLLAILALSPGGEATREKICGLLWGDRSEEQARASLRQSLASLRKELGPVLAEALRARDDAVGLAFGRTNVDALEFLSASQTVDMENQQVAAGLYAGELLADVELREQAFDEWLMEQRRRFADRASAVLERLAQDHSNTNRIEDAQGNVVMTQMLMKGDTYRVPDRVGLVVIAGDGGLLSYVVDGKEKGILGTPGEILVGRSLDLKSLGSNG